MFISFVILLVLRLNLTKDAQSFIFKIHWDFSFMDYVSGFIYTKVYLFLSSIVEFFLF